LRLHAEDGPLEVYLVLASQLDQQADHGCALACLGGRTGWVLRDASGIFTSCARSYV
jgi:hypothetical protein